MKGKNKPLDCHGQNVFRISDNLTSQTLTFCLYVSLIATGWYYKCCNLN